LIQGWVILKKKIFEKTNIPQENFFQKNFLHKTTAEKNSHMSSEPKKACCTEKKTSCIHLSWEKNVAGHERG